MAGIKRVGAGFVVALSLPLQAAAPLRELNAAVPMRDGVRLSANVFRPAAPGRYPTILLRTPYDKGPDITPNFRSFVDRGYALVVEDVRGRYGSEGNFEPLNQEIHDGDDTLNWIARQSWSNGNVGMYGGSYLGIAQWKAAMSHNPHLKAIFPYVSGDDDYRDRFYSTGGAMKLGHRLLWIEENLRPPDFQAPLFSSFIRMLPTRRADEVVTGHSVWLWQAAANHPTYDRFWKNSSVREHLPEIRVPVWSVGGWYDNYVESDLDAFATLSRLGRPARITIGPWPHVFTTPFANVSFGKDAMVPLRPLQLKWFDRWVKGMASGVASNDTAHAVRIFVMGVNQWRDEDEWPPARSREVKFYLGAQGELSERPGRGGAPDTFVYDPANPAPTVGGAVCCDNAVFPWGPLDQREVERRRDVLTYTTSVLGSDVEVTGPIRVVLYASSSAVDTDFTAKLVDVFPGGEARILTDGILRARYRESLEAPKLMKPGTVYRLTIDAGVTSNVFRAGHRIRVEISSSNFPRFDRNPNTGRPVGDEKELRKALQSVFHEGDRRSYVALPVTPAPAGGKGVELTLGRPTRYVAKSTSFIAQAAAR